MDLTLATAIKKALGTYPLVRDKYYGDVFTSVYDFLDTGKRMTSFKNDIRLVKYRPNICLRFASRQGVCYLHT